jgi:uncharacterized protein
MNFPMKEIKSKKAVHRLFYRKCSPRGGAMKIAIAAVFLAIVTAIPLMSQSQMYDDRPKITVNGEAVVYVTPDRIIVSLGIETQDMEIIAAKLKNNEILAKTVDVIKELGIPGRDVQTDRLSIEPRYRSDYRKEEFIGYFVRNTLVVTLSEAEKVEVLITKVLQAGVNYIHGIDFQSSDFKKYREQARELALKAAKEKAEKMAGVLGQAVGAPIQINENMSGSNYSYYSGWGRSQTMIQNSNLILDSRSGSGEISDTIALGKISIKANVNVTFELRK